MDFPVSFQAGNSFSTKKMPIMFHANGMAQFIPDSEIKPALRRGMRIHNPNPSPVVTESESNIEQSPGQGSGETLPPETEDSVSNLAGEKNSSASSLPNLAEDLPQTVKEEKKEPTVLVNSATLKELVRIPGLPTGQAKNLIAGRPYRGIDDVIAKYPDFDWVAIAGHFDFSDSENQG